jgi:NTE family protein
MNNLKLGVALGGGGARGWAHIGVLRALAAQGLRPDYIAGASIGSLVGAAAVTDQLDKLEDWVRALSRTDVFKLLDARFRGGVIQGNRLMAAIEDLLSDQPIETLQGRYGAVATDMETGREIWLREGSLLAAVRASCALPGLFSPVRYERRWLIDGGVVNPVPVSLCYALGADVVIAVNLNASQLRRTARRPAPAKTSPQDDEERSYLSKFKGVFESWLPQSEEPSIVEVLSSAIRIMQERITRSRLAGEPPTLEISPVVELQLMDFHRASEAIKSGEQAVKSQEAALERLQDGRSGSS